MYVSSLDIENIADDYHRGEIEHAVKVVAGSPSCQKFIAFAIKECEREGLSDAALDKLTSGLIAFGILIGRRLPPYSEKPLEPLAVEVAGVA